MAWAILKGAMNVAEMGKTVDPRYRSAHDAGAGLGVMIMLAFWAAGSCSACSLTSPAASASCLRWKSWWGVSRPTRAQSDAALCCALVPTLPVRSFVRRCRTGRIRTMTPKFVVCSS